MITGTIGALLMTPFALFPSFGSFGHGSYSFTAAPQAQAEARVEATTSHSNWWENRWNVERPTIDEIDPEAGPVGTEVTIAGSGFSDESEVRFGRHIITDVEVDDEGESLTFTVPETIDRDCPWYRSWCEDQEITPGWFNLRVQNDYRVSSVVRFEVTAEDDDPSEEETLAIEAINGPTELLIDEEGTWTVDVQSEVDGNLRYSVKWGDEDMGLMRLFSNDSDETQSSATFTHTYTEEGTYTPEFTVTAEDGTTVTKAAAEVTIEEEADEPDAPAISSIDPATAEVGETITIHGSGFEADTRVRIGGMAGEEVVVEDEETITFMVPETLSPDTYRLAVVNENGRSNAVAITIEETVEDEGHVSVSGISAPTALDVGEEGTWTVYADSTLEGNLRYSVTWGDEMVMARGLAIGGSTQSSATFTHIYMDEGDYEPTFTVTDENGNTASASASVVVE